MALKVNNSGTYKTIHELYRNNNGTASYIGELYKSNGQGGYEHIFSAGYDSTVTGTTPLTLPNARAIATTWEIDGNSSQSGTPTPTNPIEVKGVGDLSGSNYVVPILQANNCGMVDLGTLNWTKREYNNNQYFFISLTDAPDTAPSTVANMYSTLPYSIVSFIGRKDKCIFQTTNFFQPANSLYIRDDSLAELTAEQFKSAMSDKYLYYQRTTDTTWNIPTITNISLPTPLQKISTYKDSIESDGTLTRGVGKLILTGTEANWSGSSYFMLSVRGMAAMSYGPGYCTHGIVDLSNDRIVQLGSNNNTSYWCEKVKPEGVTDLATWKSWLTTQYNNGNPVVLYFPLATPTETAVEVPTISTAKGTNYVSVETELAPSNTSFTYRKRTQ